MSKKEKKSKKVRSNLVDLGDNAKKKYDKSKDLKAGLLAVRAYAEATRSAVAQVQYKKLTGFPVKIEYLEEED